MNIDQELVKLFFSVVNITIPFVFTKIIDLIKSKTEYDAAIDIVSNLVKVNVSAAKETIESAIIEASEDDKITDEEFQQIKDLVVKSVKDNLTKSVMEVLSKKLTNVDEYIEKSVAAEMQSPTTSNISIKNSDGTLNIDAVLGMCSPEE